MSWTVLIEHEGGNYSPGSTEPAALFSSHIEANQFVNSAVWRHGPEANLVITIKKTCAHGKQAEFVRASRKYLNAARAEGFGNFGTWEKVSADMCSAFACRKCGGPVE